MDSENQQGFEGTEALLLHGEAISTMDKPASQSNQRVSRGGRG